MVAARKDIDPHRQAAAGRGVGVGLRLPLELRQLVAADEQAERRRTVRQRSQRVYFQYTSICPTA